MHRIRILLFIIAFVLAAVAAPAIALGQTSGDSLSNIKYEKVNLKDGSQYFIKRLKEKVVLILLSYSPQKKLNYYKKLLTVRLSELKFIVDNRDISNIQVASQRYFTTAGQLTNFLLSKNSLATNKESIKQLFSEHIKIIEILEKSYDNTTAEWRLLRDDANYLKDYTSFLNK
jgi:hypothetical protein